MQTYPDIINKATDQQYSVVRVGKDNLKDLAFLHSHVYGAAPKEDHFLRKYDTAYTGVEYVGFLAYAKNNYPIAFYGVIPCFLTYQNKIVLAAQSADTMTHPKFRGKGLFVELATMTFELCLQLDIRLIFGFPNQNSYPGFMKLGWENTELMSYFSIPAFDSSSWPLLQIKRSYKKLYMEYFNLTQNRKRAVKGVDNSVLKTSFAGVYRYEDYFQYKAYNTSKVFTIGEVKVWASLHHEFRIGDIQNLDENNFADTISQLRKMAKSFGLKRLHFHCSPGTVLHDLFSKHYTAHPSFPIIFKDLGTDIPLDKIKFTFADIDIF